MRRTDSTLVVLSPSRVPYRVEPELGDRGWYVVTRQVWDAVSLDRFRRSAAVMQ